MYSKFQSTLTILFILINLTACASISPLEIQQVEGSPTSQTTLYGATAGVRYVVARNQNDGRVICAEPMPDAAFDDEDKFSFSIINTGDESADEQSGAVEAGLGGRSVNVLITREVLFRYCELLANSDFNKEEKATMFKEVLNSLVKIHKVNLGSGTASEAESSMGTSESNDSAPHSNESILPSAAQSCSEEQQWCNGSCNYPSQC